MTTALIKLKSGELIIGDLEQTGLKWFKRYKIFTPFNISYQNGSYHLINFVPFMKYGLSITVKQKDILFINHYPDESIKTVYFKQLENLHSDSHMRELLESKYFKNKNVMDAHGSYNN